MHLRDVLAEYGRSEGCHFQLNEHGTCAMLIDDHIEIIVEEGPDTQTAYLYIPLPTPQTKDWAITLMGHHLYGINTHQCYYAQDPKDQQLMLFTTLDLNIVDPHRFRQRIEDLVAAYDAHQQLMQPQSVSLPVDRPLHTAFA